MITQTAYKSKPWHRICMQPTKLFATLLACMSAAKKEILCRVKVELKNQMLELAEGSGLQLLHICNSQRHLCKVCRILMYLVQGEVEI